MDLLGALNIARKALDIVGRPTRQDSWATDEQAFVRHFGVPYKAYAEVLEHLSSEQMNLLQATLEVNPEAAVLWVLAMEELES